jgi:hypothetical protein
VVGPAAVEAHHQPGHQGGGGGGGQNTITIEATSPVVAGSPTTVSGRLQGSGNASVEVDLEADAHPYNDSEFARVATTMTAANGDYSFSQQPQLNTRYRAVAKASPPVTSAVATVLVRLRVTRSVSDRTPERGSRVRFRGKVCPEHDGKVAHIQRRRSDGKFRTVAQTLLKDVPNDPCSGYARRVRIRRDGTYRVRVPSGDEDHIAGISRRVRIDAG